MPSLGCSAVWKRSPTVVSFPWLGDSFFNASSAFPNGREFSTFLAIALYNIDEYNRAVNLLLYTLVETTGDPAIRQYERALIFYANHLDKTWCSISPISSIAEKLAALGLHTIGDLACWPEGDLARRFGKHGHDLAQHARGLTLRRKQIMGTTVKLKIRWGDFTTVTRQTTLPQPTDAPGQIYGASERLLAKLWSGQLVRLIGAGVSGLGALPRQLNLWDKPDEKAERLHELIQALQTRFGREVIQRGAVLISDKGDEW